VFEFDIRVVWRGYEEAGEGNSSALTGGRCSGAAMVLYMTGCRRLAASSNQRSCWGGPAKGCALATPQSRPLADVMPTTDQLWPRGRGDRIVAHCPIRAAERFASARGGSSSDSAACNAVVSAERRTIRWRGIDDLRDGAGRDAAAMPWSGVSVAIEWRATTTGLNDDDSSSACAVVVGTVTGPLLCLPDGIGCTATAKTVD
jgi:hypothetical protein